MDSYGSHPALYKRLQGGRELPVYYMYDSYQVPEDVWRELFSRLSENTVRDTELDGVFFGKLLKPLIWINGSVISPQYKSRYTDGLIEFWHH